MYLCNVVRIPGPPELRSEDDMNRATEGKPQISAPVLLSTTLNPNDADGHRNVAAFAMRKSASVSSSLASSSASSSTSNSRLSFKVRTNGRHSFMRSLVGAHSLASVLCKLGGCMAVQLA